MYKASVKKFIINHTQRDTKKYGKKNISVWKSDLFKMYRLLYIRKYSFKQLDMTARRNVGLWDESDSLCGLGSMTELSISAIQKTRLFTYFPF